MIILLVDPAPDGQHDGHIGQHQQVEPDRGDGGLDDDLPEVPDEEVDRVQKEEVPHHGGIVVDGVEDGGHIHQQLGEHAPEVLDIPEEDEQGGEDEAHPDVEQHKAPHREEEADELPGEGDVVQNAEDKKHAQGKAEVDEGLNILGEEEQVLWHIDLGKDAGVAHEGGHALTGGLVEVGEDQVAAKQIGGIMGGIAAKKLRKDQPHDQKGQQRGQHAPGHTQHGALILFLKISLDQFLKEKLVRLQFLKHNQSCLSNFMISSYTR